MSIVPLNFGAAAPFRAKLHFAQVIALSAFWVPQFGQNTRRTSALGRTPEPTRQGESARRSIAATIGKNQSKNPASDPAKNPGSYDALEATIRLTPRVS